MNSAFVRSADAVSIKKQEKHRLYLLIQQEVPVRFGWKNMKNQTLFTQYAFYSFLLLTSFAMPPFSKSLAASSAGQVLFLAAHKVDLSIFPRPDRAVSTPFGPSPAFYWHVPGAQCFRQPHQALLGRPHPWQGGAFPIHWMLFPPSFHLRRI